MGHQSDGSIAADPRVVEAAIAAARGFVPRIVELAPRMQADRKLDDDLMDDMEKAGLFSLLVPKRWGGAALGPHEVNQVTEIIGAADCSTGWVVAFYIMHNWFLCKFPLEVQEKLYARGRSSVRAPGVFGPPGTAERVDGGYRVSGRWPYASGAWGASYVLVPAMIGDALHWFLMAREEVDYVDDWYMEAMSATGSITITAQDVFVTDAWHCEINKIIHATDYPGAGVHDEPAYRLPFSTLLMASLSPCLGALDRAVEMARERLPRSMPLGYPRIERPAARIRWAEVFQMARVLRMVRDGATEGAIRRGLTGEPPTLESEAESQLHLVYFVRGVKDALRQLIDGLGTSSYRQNDPIFRMCQDAAVLATHAQGPDYDVAIDRNARWLLGLGMAPGDPGARLA